MKHQQVQIFWRKNLRGSPDCKVKPFVEGFTDFFELDLLKNSNERYERFIYRLDVDAGRVSIGSSTSVTRSTRSCMCFPGGKRLLTSERSTRLSLSSTHSVRRADETKELKNAINTCRLITVYAERGLGKSALALEVAKE